MASTSFSAVELDEGRSNDPVKSPKSASFGGVERIRSSSFDGFHSKHFTDATYRYPDWNASSFGINRIGKLAILAAKRGFMLIDFDYPNEERKYHCNFKWEPGSLEWNPHHAQDYLFASVMNQKVEIWNVKSLSSGASPYLTLSEHTRAISDVNWNYFEPHSLLTCSMDTYINLWDIRQSKRPSSTFTTVAGSSQVKWNRKNHYLFGSAHDGDIRIWDTRKGNMPVVYIAGHLSKIHGFDWCPTKEDYFVTASNDTTVKFWNLKTPKQPWGSINNGSPVWKARYTPFGNGLVTILVPQLRRTENSLVFWSTTEFKSPVHKFTGHEDVVLEFQWRSQKKDDRDEHQLVSWSKDQTLRLWRASKKMIQSITGEPYLELAEESISPALLAIDDSHFDEKRKSSKVSPDVPPIMSSTYKDPSTLVKKDVVKQAGKKTQERREQLTLLDLNLMDTNPAYTQSPLSPRSARGMFNVDGKQQSLSPTGSEASGYMTPTQILHQEFTLLNLNSPVFKIEKLDSDLRECIIAARAGHIFFKLNINFPLTYPNKSSPNFLFTKDSIIDTNAKQQIVSSLMEVSNQHVKFNRPCLEACLRKLRYLIELLQANHPTTTGENPAMMPTGSYPFKREAGSDTSYMDSTVPFPRTCGARFCSVGDILVVFSRPEKYDNFVIAERSLRSMSALNDYLQETDLDGSGENQTGSLKKPKVIGQVYVSNTSVLLPVSKELAQNYVLHGDDPSALCLRNAHLAASVKRKDLVQTWTLLSKILAKEIQPSTLMPPNKTPWACHPFGRKLIKSLFNYYERLKDVQTLAMMSCLLMKQHLPDDMQDISRIEQLQNKEKQPSRPSTRFSNPEIVQLSPEFSPYDIYNRSVGHESWSPPNFTTDEKVMVDPEEEIRKQHRQNCQFLNPDDEFRYDQYKRNYAEVLYRWNMHSQRTEVVKYCSERQEEKKVWDIKLECTTCCAQHNQPCCPTCKSFIVKCSVCRIGVRGLLSFCKVCGHGGHMFHLIDWFKDHEWCATGCGCYCLKSGQFATPQ